MNTKKEVKGIENGRKFADKTKMKEDDNMSKFYSLDTSPENFICSKVWGTNLTSSYLPRSQVSYKYINKKKNFLSTHSIFHLSPSPSLSLSFTFFLNPSSIYIQNNSLSSVGSSIIIEHFSRCFGFISMNFTRSNFQFKAKLKLPFIVLRDDDNCVWGGGEMLPELKWECKKWGMHIWMNN